MIVNNKQNINLIVIVFVPPCDPFQVKVALYWPKVASLRETNDNAVKSLILHLYYFCIQIIMTSLQNIASWNLTASASNKKKVNQNMALRTVVRVTVENDNFLSKTLIYWLFGYPQVYCPPGRPFFFPSALSSGTINSLVSYKHVKICIFWYD